MTALLLACGAPDPEAPAPTMTELPPFEDPAIEAAWQRLAAWADARRWTATPLRRRGPRLERAWVRGEVGRGAAPAPGAARVALSVFASSEAATSHGLQWDAAITDTAGHGVELLLVSGGEPITSDQVRIDLRRGADRPVELGAPLTWKVGERVLQTPRPKGLAEVQAKLARYLGPSFADEAAADVRALEAVGRAVVDGGDYLVCDYGPSPGRGVPGPCLPRAPTDAEREAHRAAFDAEIARRLEVVGDGAVWSELLRAIAPPP